MSKYKKSLLLFCAGAALIGAAAASAVSPAAAADESVRLKISLWIPPAHPLVPSAKEWADSIEKASGGTIKSTIFPSEQLGKAFDHYDMVRDRIADVGYINPGYQPGRFPIFSAAVLPFTIAADARKGSAAVDAWYRKYAPTEMKDTHFCLAFVHDPGSIHARKKITTPEDMKGVKVRPAHSAMGEFVTSLGGTNVQASAPEARDILERGVADAITFPWQSLFLFGIDKVVKYHIDAPIYTTAFTWSINKQMYDGLSATQKKVIDDHCTNEWAVKIAGPWADYEAAGRQKMKETAGHEVYPLTPEQLAAWRKAASPMHERWAASVKSAGGDPETVFKDLTDSLAKYQAAY
jgi:TRAP-type C4-dicarboxylate transport system substrate-binding protein